jgi:hypothetical protein
MDILTVSILFALVIVLFFAWGFYDFGHYKTRQNDANIHIILHFIHGSVPTKNCSDQRIRLGGKWGGHVEIEIDGNLYSFEIKDRTQSVHFLPKKKRQGYNAVFFKIPKEKWLETTENDKITSIYLPISATKKEEILNIYNGYLQQLPYDYAFLGMRCTSSAHHILAQIGVFKPCSKWRTIVFSFYPKMLRRKAVLFAQRNNFSIVLKDGIECRDWE